MKIKPLMLTGALLGAAHAADVAALSFAEVPSLDAIAGQASLAFRGVVLGIEHADAQVDETHSVPYTLTHLRALACYRGCRAGEEVTIARMGGPRQGDMRHYLVIPGIASFAAGEEVVVFSDDTKHPFFGTLYGDAGALRVARADGGERIVLSYHGHPLIETTGRLGIDATRRCAPIAGQPGDCFSIARETAEPSDEDGVRRGTPTAVTPEALDRRMAEIVQATPLERPAQTVSADKQTFARALAQLLRHSRGR